MKKIFTAAMALLCAAATAYAEGGDESKFSIKPTGRILLDGALYASPQKEMFKDGAAIPDVRLGAKMSYGKWDAKIDVGFADAKVKASMEEPVSNAVFNDSRQLGVMFVHYGDKFLATASAHVEPSSTKVILAPTQFTQEGYGFRSRLVYRPVHSDGKTVQVGFSGGFASPQRRIDADGVDVHDGFQFKSNFPTRVTQVTALDAVVDHSMNLWKFTPELLLSYDRVALETQYFFQQVNRRQNLPHYRTQGAYATLRGLILGDKYGYAMYDGGLATPNNKGQHYSYPYVWNRAGADPTTLNGFMARLQVIF